MTADDAHSFGEDLDSSNSGSRPIWVQVGSASPVGASSVDRS